MTTITRCDICKKKIKHSDLIRVGWEKEYCKKCWLDEKNWVQIHSVEKSFHIEL